METCKTEHFIEKLSALIIRLPTCTESFRDTKEQAFSPLIYVLLSSKHACEEKETFHPV